jgi:hypothetical protein
MAKWLYEVKGWGKVIESDDPFEVQRDKLVVLLRDSEWFKAPKDEYEQDELESAIDDLEYAQSAGEADDDALYRIYNQADEQRVWLDPAS